MVAQCGGAKLGAEVFVLVQQIRRHAPHAERFLNFGGTETDGKETSFIRLLIILYSF